jgi:heme-degrading monooxygenase HmoA
MAAYHLVWEFETDPERRADFEAAYGPDGLWVALFRQADGYLGTELLREVGGACRYVTIDRWSSRGAYDSFRLRHAVAHAALDARCQALTMREVFLGDGEDP